MSGMGNRCVTLALKNACGDDLSDGVGLSVARMHGKTESEISKLTISGETSICIGDAFDVTVGESVDRSLVLRGDFSSVRHLAATHDRGTIEIDGNAGDYLGGALEGCRTGMTGGRVVVRGHVGKQAGYRMRRGEIFVAGDAGDFMAAHMIAGTIGVAGQVGKQVGYGMRRGSLLLANEPSLLTGRVTSTIRTEASWLRLIVQLGDEKLDHMLAKMASSGCRSCRGDAAVGGVGELVWCD